MRTCLIFFLFLASLLPAQVNFDSLNKVANDLTLPDSARLKSLRAITAELGYINPDSSMHYARKELELAQKAKEPRYEGHAFLSIGKVYYYWGKNIEALNEESKALKIYEGIHHRWGQSQVLCNMGNVFLQMGDYSSAVIHYSKSLKIAEEIKDTNLIIANIGNIGIIYASKKDFKKSMEFSNRHLSLSKTQGDKFNMSYSYRYIGKAYEGMKEFTKAIRSFSFALRLCEENKDENGISYCLNYLGSAYMNAGDYNKALDFFNHSLKMAEHRKDRYGIAENLDLIGNCYYELKDYQKALSFCTGSLKITEESGLAPVRRNASASLWRIQKKLGNFAEALAMHELYMTMRDSITNEESQSELVKQEMQNLYEKQQAINEKEHEKELAVSAEQEKKQKVIIYAVVAGLILVLLCALIVLQRLRVTRRQKNLIEMQKQIVEEKQREIMDSIHYAKRIQLSLLPNEKYIGKKLNEGKRRVE